MANKNKSIEVEREYTIPLRREIEKVPRHKRTPKAIKAIKEFAAKHMKVPDRDLSKVKIDKYLNQEMWFRGIKKPLTKIKVKMKKQNDNVIVELAQIPDKVKFQMAREEKLKKSSEKAKKKEAKEEKKEQTTEHTPEEKKEEKEKLEAVKDVKELQAEQQAKQAKHVKKEISPKAQHRMALKK